jgi:hypothetical protein
MGRAPASGKHRLLPGLRGNAFRSSAIPVSWVGDVAVLIQDRCAGVPTKRCTARLPTVDWRWSRAAWIGFTVRTGGLLWGAEAGLEADG